MIGTEKKIVLQYLSIAIAFTCLFQYLFYFFFADSLFFAFACLFSSVIFFVVWYVNKKDEFHVARIIYFSSSTALVSLFSLFMDKESDMYLYFIPLLLLLFILFEYPSEKKWMSILSVFVMINIAVVLVFGGRYKAMEFSPFVITYVKWSNYFTSLAASIIAVIKILHLYRVAKTRLDFSLLNLRSMYDSSSEAIVLIDKEGYLLDFNSAAFEDTKLTQRLELQRGKSFLSFLKPTFQENFKGNFNRCLSGENIIYKQQIINDLGEKKAYEHNMIPVLGPERRIIGVSISSKDITKKYIEDEEDIRRKKLLSLIFEEFPDALFLLESNNKIFSINSHAKKLFQIETSQEPNYFSESEFLSGMNSNDLFSKISERLSRHGEWKGELEFRTQKDTLFTGEMLVRKIEVFDRTFNLCKIVDITGMLKEKENVQLIIEQLQKQLLSVQKREDLAVIIDGQEKERQRFSKELHDGIGQALTAIRLQVAAIERNEQEAFLFQKQKINNTIDNAISEVKRISNNLMPSAIEDLGVVAALEHMCKLVPTNKGIEFECDPQIAEIKLNNTQQFVIYRIAQEAVNNAVKYSEAKWIRVSYGLNHKQELFLRVEDNGKGFSTEKLIAFYEGRALGNGLSNMKERADMIGAHFEVQSVLGEGTKIYLSLKLNKDLRLY